MSSFNRIYLARLFKVFTNLYRYRVKFFACGLLVMVSLLCYILKSSTYNQVQIRHSDLSIDNENSHVVRHGNIMRRKSKLAPLVRQIDLLDDSNNIEISSQNNKKRNSLLEAKPVDKNQIDILDYYKQNEMLNNKIGSNNVPVDQSINAKKTNDVVYQNPGMGNVKRFNVQNSNYIIREDYETVEKSLKNLDRIIHIDLKGAPPKIDYFRQFIPMLKEYGANGILLEYEDMFPFEGILAEAKHGHAYSIQDINLIKQLAKDNNLYIIPLVQTYGHLEWLLKLKKFAHLRDNSDFPQVITQCSNESYTILFEMLDQVIKHHSDVPYFHIGCDEVYYKLMHPNCSNLPFRNDFTEAFMNHLIKIANHVKTRLKNTKVIFWDDMLHNMDEFSLKKFKPAILALEMEPMIWAYAENIKDWFQPDLYIKYGKIFENVWAASAYKGASGELTTVTSIQHHYLNHLSWIEVILEKHKLSVVKFRGIAITGWSRYDHFLAVCDLLPQAIPSLIYNLQTMQLGRITPEKKYEISSKLGCTNTIPWTPEEIYDGYILCNFTGHEVYEAILPINNILKTLQYNLEFADKYMTPLNLDYNYVHKARGFEVLERLKMDYYALIRFKKKFTEAAVKIYHNDTVDEWLYVYLIPYLDPLYKKIELIKNLIKINDWKPRPLPVKIKTYPEFI